MFRRNKKTRKYQAPFAKVMPMELESNFCTTNPFNGQADELDHLYHVDGKSVSEESEQLYFEF